MKEHEKKIVSTVGIFLVVWVLAGVGATVMAEGFSQENWSVANILIGAVTLGVSLYLGISQLVKPHDDDANKP